MANKDVNSLEQKLVDLFGSVVDELQERIKSGDASPTDISNAIKLLSNNGISIEPKAGDETILLEALNDISIEEDFAPPLLEASEIITQS